MITKVIKKDISQILEEMKKDLPLLEGKNVLITGGAGMLGSYLVYTLMAANEQILKKPTKLYLVIRSKKSPFGKNKNIRYLHSDIAKEVPHVKKIHYIIHAASKAAPKFYLKDRIDTINTNILGLYHLLQTSDKHLKSFLYFSSCDVYGQPSNNNPIKEDYIGQTNHLSPRSSYAEAKRACETICMNYFWEKKLPVKIARIFHTFGPGLNLNDGRSFSDFIRFGLEGSNIKILGDKNKKRAMLYVKDSAIMFLKLLLSKKNGQIYNIGNDKNIVSIGEFAETICDTFNNGLKTKMNPSPLQAAGYPASGTSSCRTIHPRSRAARYSGSTIKVVYGKKSFGYFKGAVDIIKPDITKFTSDFHYKPTTSIKEAVSRTVNHYLSLKNYGK